MFTRNNLQCLFDAGDIYDNEFVDKYLNLLNTNSCDYLKGVTQEHHVIPKSWYIHNNIEIDNSNNNLVNLVYYDHILAHFYLFKCAKSKKFKSTNSTMILFAFKNKRGIDLTKVDEIPTEILVEIQEAYEYSRKYDTYKETKRLEGLRKLETRLKMSESAKRYFKIHGGRVTKPTEGKLCYTNGIINTYAFECPEGFVRGKTLSESSRKRMGSGKENVNHNTTGGKIAVYKEGHKKYILNTDLDDYINSGYTLEMSDNIKSSFNGINGKQCICEYDGVRLLFKSISAAFKHLESVSNLTYSGINTRYARALQSNTDFIIPINNVNMKINITRR